MSDELSKRQLDDLETRYFLPRRRTVAWILGTVLLVGGVSAWSVARRAARDVVEDLAGQAGLAQIVESRDQALALTTEMKSLHEQAKGLLGIRLIYGTVNKLGEVAGASDGGWRAERINAGTYDLVFDAPFSSTPHLLATTANAKAARSISTIGTAEDRISVMIWDRDEGGRWVPRDTDWTFLVVAEP